MDYFGLWIDSSFNHGHSKAVPKCTTYGSPQLSGQAQFEVEAMEVWGVGPEKKRLSSDEGEGVGIIYPGKWNIQRITCYFLTEDTVFKFFFFFFFFCK